MSTDDAENREKLRKQVEAVEAAALVPHHHRGALIIVEARLDFLEAAVAVACDDSVAVAQWLTEGAVRKPSAADVAQWCVDERRFQFVIVQPYVVAQLLPTGEE